MTYDDRREQRARILRYMRWRGERGIWVTVQEASAQLSAHWRVPFPENSVSAQFRNLRKRIYGGWDIQRRTRAGRLSEYCLVGRQIVNPSLFSGLTEDTSEGVR